MSDEGDFAQRSREELIQYICTLRAAVEENEVHADLFRKIVDLGIDFHREGRQDSEDEAVWADDVMVWTDGDRLKAAQQAIQTAVFNRSVAR